MVLVVLLVHFALDSLFYHFGVHYRLVDIFGLIILIDLFHLSFIFIGFLLSTANRLYFIFK